MAVGWALGIAEDGAQRAGGTEGRVCVYVRLAPLFVTPSTVFGVIV
jgi:hypothetical protein